MIVQGSSIHIKRTPFRIKILILLITISFVFVTEFAYRDVLFNVSIGIIESMQKNSSFIFLKTMSYFQIIVGKKFLAFIIMIVYNFANIYKSFLLIMILCIISLTTSLLKLRYTNPRPYYNTNPNTILPFPFPCEHDYGNPSDDSIIFILFYSALFKMIIESGFKHKNMALKIILYVALCFLFFILMVTRLASGLDSLNQIIFGSLIGLCIYYVLFHLIEINTNDSKQLLKVVQMKNIYYFLLNFILLIPILLLIFLKEYETDDKKNWVINIKTKCNKQEDGNFKYIENTSFQYQAFLNMGFFFSNIAAFISMKLEFYYTFNDKIENWTKYNIPTKIDDDCLLSNLSVEKDTQWNHTNNIKSLIRLVMIIILCFLLYIPFQMIPDDYPFSILLIFKEFLGHFLFNLGMFYFFKIVFRKLKLVEMSVFLFNDEL